ncbi:protein JOKA2 isoform X2 [Juglans microcarpa x Juglans regia]|uniref:protein JOKA2 isoform X2 n=1 Tax=Juglans microcarpa x Juglans regia TaxID=2249226 RepID=UPI001B7F6D1C|nr:protein JOKA2 isoform X2 [Juglans microcarpa x Juglans regia]XP_040987273.1 protein JOKA2 isoform X2 [Juglans microcarpa x Juglans regia]XP_040987274.1 protein JOKA2 isoform X2 [Juglans microcarpa x Juglans regia]
MEAKEETLVIKVKFGDTLKRIRAFINEDEKLDLDMAVLRGKILSFFNFPADADFTLTYVDEDGDVVTLADDEDLHDVVKQRLKVLRIDVQLSNDKGVNSSARSSENSTPLRSPRVLPPSRTKKTDFTEVLKSVPQLPREALKLHEALSKLSLDIVSKAASSKAAAGPMLLELVDFISKMAQSQLNLDSHSNGGAGSSTQNVAGGSSASKDGEMAEMMPKSMLVDSAAENSHRANTENVNRGVGAPVTPLLKSVDLNLPPTDSNPLVTVKVGSFASDVPVGEDRKSAKKNAKKDSKGKSSGCVANASSSVPARPTHPTNLRRVPFNECPFAGTTIGNDLAVPFFGYHPHHPSKRSHRSTPPVGGIFHKGVQCDGCGVHPITGPRYKSKVKSNYDLCSICFSEMGNETDYWRMDRPMSCRIPRSFNDIWEQMDSQMDSQMGSPWVATPDIFNLSNPKLDSRFILDVNVMDGTVMAPSTPFTKIWKMRNNGSAVWPRGTQLVWIEGDRLSNAFSVEIEVPENGVPVGQELDIAVDLTAPASPGRYTSIWKMASPSHQMFGQRIWVMIQVDKPEGLNLNLSPDGVLEIIDANGELLQSGLSNTTTEPVKPVVDEPLPKDHDLNFPINDTLLVGNGISSSSATQEAVSYPIIDVSDVALAAPNQAPSNAPGAPSHAQSDTPSAPTQVPFKVVDLMASAQGVTVKNAVEETLLKELEEMGFKQVDLNKEILRMNEYNLEKSVDDLCGVSEWDPILEELREMGFRDDETNKRLLMKNNGSIKRVVMDLMSGERRA